jgi:hypothetical protein
MFRSCHVGIFLALLALLYVPSVTAAPQDGEWPFFLRFWGGQFTIWVRHSTIRSVILCPKVAGRASGPKQSVKDFRGAPVSRS